MSEPKAIDKVTDYLPVGLYVLPCRKSDLVYVLPGCKWESIELQLAVRISETDPKLSGVPVYQRPDGKWVITCWISYKS